jgi:hypothetical protein
MTQQQNTSILRVMHEVCCGHDVHKELINACLITTDENGHEDSELKVFQTFSDDLCRLRDWLLDHNCPIIAMESTGIYWRPLHNILEGFFEVIHLANIFIIRHALVNNHGLARLESHARIKEIQHGWHGLVVSLVSFEDFMAQRETARFTTKPTKT